MLERNELTLAETRTTERLPKPDCKRKVWLVDDDVSIRNLLAEILPTHAELQIDRSFGSVPALMEALDSFPHPDVLVLDNHIGLDLGVDAIESVKPIAPETQIVMLTTCFDSVLRTKALARGACDFLTKSQPLEQISKRIFDAKPSEPVEESVTGIVERKSLNRVSRKRWSLQRYIAGWRGWRKQHTPP